jgi:hypothetical protein
MQFKRPKPNAFVIPSMVSTGEQSIIRLGPVCNLEHMHKFDELTVTHETLYYSVDPMV